jgi:hypothetical protein
VLIIAPFFGDFAHIALDRDGIPAFDMIPATTAPSCARRSAMARPIPLDTPVTLGYVSLI